MTDNLEYIIKGCVAGKNSSREMLYRQYSGKMWAICLRYTHDHDEAKDILQDGFMKIFEKISQFEGRGHFEGWMRKIIVNTALAVYRKKHFLNIETSLVAEKSDEPEGQIECKMSADELLEIINELSPQYKIVFNLYAIEGYTHKEISEMLGISEGTSKSNLSRARYILQKKVTTVFDAGIKLG